MFIYQRTNNWYLWTLLIPPPKITQVVTGQLSVIKPNVAHTMVSKDTTFLNLVRGERDHENYGITHTIKHAFVDEKEKNLLLKCYKFECRSCENTNSRKWCH